VAIAVGIGFAVTRDDTPTTRVQTQPSQPAAVVPLPVSNVPKKLPAAVAPPTAPAATAKTTPNVVASSPASTPNAAAPAPTAAPQPQTSPPSALQWTAPASISVKHGAKTTIHVTAHNPTKGTITLPNPLSCAPTLDNSGFCVEMAQLVQPGASASATYTIDATNVAPGHYTLAIEGGLLKIPATVTS
jgi:hypothetical protein